MKKCIFWTVASAILLLGSCNKEDIQDPTPQETVTVPTLTIRAAMPDENPSPQTRVALTETVGGNLSVQWKEGDKIHLCFVSEDGNTVRTVADVAVTNISANGKSGEFAIEIPTEEITGRFNLYGIYGATFKEANSKTVVFPATPTVGTSLANAEEICVMKFAQTGLDAGSSVNVSFQHLGSIIGIWLFNATTNSYNVTSLSMGNESYQWLGNDEGAAEYDIAAGVFTNRKPGNTLSFISGSTLSITGGETKKLYRWVVPAADYDNTKQLVVTINDGTNNSVAIPVITMAQGKYYRLKLLRNYAVWGRVTSPSASDLVGHWPFDGNTQDAKGTNHVTESNGVSLATDRYGNANSAYSFSGSGSYMKCTTAGITGSINPRTITFWAKADNLTTTSQTILVWGGDIYTDGSRFEVTLVNNQIICDISTSNYGKTTSAIVNNVWNFYAVVYTPKSTTYVNPNTLYNTIRFYVNGIVPTAEGVSTKPTIPVNTHNTNPIYFGSLYNTERRFQGTLDDIRIYDKALSQAEIIGLYLSQEQPANP